jgi:hypothetical protein
MDRQLQIHFQAITCPKLATCFDFFQKAIIRHSLTTISEIKRFVYKILFLKGGTEISVLQIFRWACFVYWPKLS